jgi:OOP family OmpA-OmpF porin
MQENKTSKVTLSGHTDNIGTDAYNRGLSERRVNAVRDYVVKKGVDSGRISGQGFGESKPIADNKTREGRAKNRRVEIKVD